MDEDKVREMRRLRKEENLSYKELGELFGIHHANAGNICRGVSWQHVKD
jgi:transcriptional regulator with XRE-family HTH domain